MVLAPEGVYVGMVGGKIVSYKKLEELANSVAKPDPETMDMPNREPLMYGAEFAVAGTDEQYRLKVRWHECSDYGILEIVGEEWFESGFGLIAPQYNQIDRAFYYLGD